MIKHSKIFISSVLIVIMIFTIWGFHVPEALAAIAFDASSTVDADGCITDALTPFVLSWSHTTTGSDRLLVVGIAMTDDSENITGITYNAISMTNIRTDSNAGVDQGETSLWYLVNPSSGANTITATNDSSFSDGCGDAVSLTGVDQDNPLDANNGNTADNADSISSTVTTVADNAWIVDIVSKTSNPGDLTVGANQTSRQNLDGVTYDHGMSTVDGKSPAGAEAMDWNDGGQIGTFSWAHSAASFKPAAVAASASDRNPPFHLIIQDSELKIEDSELIIIN